MKYLKIKPFKELQAVESLSESDESDKIEIIEVPGNNSRAGSKRTGAPVQHDIDKKMKLETSAEMITAPEQVTSEPRLSSVQVMGHDLLYKQHAASVLFKTSSVMELLSSKMPLQQSKQLESVVDKSASDKQAFISWTGLKIVLKGGLLDLAIRETMMKEADHSESLTLNHEKVKFKIKNGTVYLEVFSAFSALGRLHEALAGNWVSVDIALAAAGVSLKAAFKKKAGGEGAGVSRSFITLDAFMIICSDEQLKKQVSRLIDQTEVMKKQSHKISTELQQTVNMIQRMSFIVPETSSDDQETPGSRGDHRTGHWRLKTCDRGQCGRGYHLTSRCCARNHSFRIADKDIGYLRRNGQLYLEKCAAFDLICRLYVIRCSDYKRVDKILIKQSGKETVDDFFLFDRDGAVKSVRTHISLNAFIVLIEQGFDASGLPDLLSEIMKIKMLYQDISQQQHDDSRRYSCEDIETIDLSSSEVDTDDKDSVSISSKIDVETTDKVKETNSSEVESEDQNTDAKVERKRLKSFHDYDSDDDSNMECGRAISEFVELLGVQIPVQIHSEKLYVDKNALVKVAGQELLQAIKNLDKILDDDLQDAIVYQGRQKVFLSVEVLQKLLQSKEMEDYDARPILLEEVDEILKEYHLERSRILTLPSSEEIKFKLINGIVYVDTVKLLILSGFTSAYFSQPPAKCNMFLCKVLSERGVNIQTCFYKHGKSKYAFISIAAASVLLRSDLGHMKDNTKSLSFIEDLLETIDTQNILNKNSEQKQDLTVTILDEFPPIKYKILDGKLFLHKKSSFECLELESSVLNNRRGYSSLNNILKSAGLDVEKCYLASRQQKYCYISCLALIYLLQSQDPLIVCLTNKDRFMLGLIKVLQDAAVGSLADTADQIEIGEDVVDIKIQDGMIYLDRVKVAEVSGLQDSGKSNDVDPRDMLEERGLVCNAACLPRAEDACGWISLHCLYLLLSSCIAELNLQKVAWRDILSAISLYQPKIKTKLRLEDFKTKLLEKFEYYFVDYSSSVIEEKLTGSRPGVRRPAETVLGNDDHELTLPVSNRYLNKVRFSDDQLVPGSDHDPSSPQPPSTLHSPVLSCHPSPTGSVTDPLWSPSPGDCLLSMERFTKLRQDILQHSGDNCGESYIGDWRLETVEENYLKLSVKSGYGASRKNSFLQPHFAAILRYSLILTPSSASLTINEKHVKSEVIRKILDKTEVEGTLSFLVQVISLRPCFGSFAPELVETVTQALSREEVPEELQHVFIDTAFIGSSSCGRTYAGTVRSTDCSILAVDRVSDVCSRCRDLSKLTINRSVLSQVSDQSNMGDQEQGQKSVWQLATTSTDSCSFVCPQVRNGNILTGNRINSLNLQVQSFNSSLPHAFDGRAQASAIVSHRVEICNNLNVQVEMINTQKEMLKYSLIKN